VVHRRKVGAIARLAVAFGPIDWLFVDDEMLAAAVRTIQSYHCIVVALNIQDIAKAEFRFSLRKNFDTRINTISILNEVVRISVSVGTSCAN
jgi:hypothetical protein